MKIIYVVDAISDLNKKIGLVKDRLGNNIFYIVKADLADLFKTYGYEPHAIYYKNLSKVINNLLYNTEDEDTIVCYASLKFDRTLLNNFANAIGNKTKIVNLSPKYNIFEKVCNSAYNVYVKYLFKIEDSLVSPKLQFLPEDFVTDFVNSHFSNRLFKLDSQCYKTITTEDKEINKSMKIKTKHLKYNLISLIIALVLTAGLLACIAYLKVNYLIIFIFTILYILDAILLIIFQCKAKFDQRFLK